MVSNKWIVARITAATALVMMWATTGSWDFEETIGLIGLVSEAATAYLTPNRPPLVNPDLGDNVA